MSDLNAVDPSQYTIETVTGRLVNLVDPSVDQISIEDIAWALSRAPRFAGHTIPLIPYSVGQHCLLVADIVSAMFTGEFSKKFKYASDLELCSDYLARPGMGESTADSIYLHGLLHDATECYTGDLPGPLKKVPTIRAIIKPLEEKIDRVIHSALNVRYPTEDEHQFIKIADQIAQRIEGHAFMPSRGASWVSLPIVTLETLQEFDSPLDSISVYKRFLSKYQKVKNAARLIG